MKKQVNIKTLRKWIEENNEEIITVFGNGDTVGRCEGKDYGESPYQYFLGLEGNAVILNIREASPIWQNLLEGMEKKRPIYKITDPESLGWMEIVLKENENEE